MKTNIKAKTQAVNMMRPALGGLPALAIVLGTEDEGTATVNNMDYLRDMGHDSFIEIRALFYQALDRHFEELRSSTVRH